MVIASDACGLPALRHHPLPDSANSQARHAGTPRLRRKPAMGFGRLRCLIFTQRSLCRIHSSRRCRRPLPGYPTVPVFYPVSVRRVRALSPASFRFRLTTDTLAFD